MLTFKLHLIRHGATEGNLSQLCIGGKTDMPLAADGIEELREMADSLVYPDIQKVYVSPMLRCTQTAETLYPDAWSEEVEGLRECDLGDFEGKSLADLHGTEEFLSWVEGRAAPPGGESAEELGKRIIAAYEYILDDMMHNKLTSAAAVTHGVVMMGLLALCGYPRRDMREWACANGCGYTVSTSAAMWMRDRCFEVTDAIPFGLPEGGASGDCDNWFEETEDKND